MTWVFRVLSYRCSRGCGYVDQAPLMLVRTYTL
jgi:hypothetical protein